MAKQRHKAQSGAQAAAAEAPRGGSEGAARARHPWLAALLLALLTFAVWGRTLSFPLVEWDDDLYIRDDDRLRPLNWENVKTIFTTTRIANYHPVTTLTYATDWALYGNWSAWWKGFHLTHLVFYLAGVVCVWMLFRRLLNSPAAAWIAALLYGIHPAHHDCVCWLACRKDVVCLAWYAAALYFYRLYAERRDTQGPVPRSAWGWYAAVGVCTILAMLSKGYAVVLGGVFIAYDVCFAPRFRWAQVLDKLPVLACALAVTVATVHAQDKDVALAASDFSAGERAVMLLKVFALYAGKSLLPIGLSAYYLTTKEGWQPTWVAVAGAALMVGLAAGFFLLRRRRPAVAFGLALFVLPLATTMNTFFTLKIWMADRYLLLPTLGALLAVTAAVMHPPRALGSWAGLLPPARKVLAIAALLVFAVLALRRVPVWSSRVLLFSDVLRARYPELEGDGRVTVRELATKMNGKEVDQDAFLKLYEAYRASGDTEQVGQFLSIVGGWGSDNIVSLQQLITARKYDEAIPKLLVMANGEEFGNHKAARLLVDCYAAKGDQKEARRWFEKARELYARWGQRQDEVDAAAPLLGAPPAAGPSAPAQNR